jgi:hypothetical protein
VGVVVAVMMLVVTVVAGERLRVGLVVITPGAEECLRVSGWNLLHQFSVSLRYLGLNLCPVCDSFLNLLCTL